MNGQSCFNLISTCPTVFSTRTACFFDLHSHSLPQRSLYIHQDFDVLVLLVDQGQVAILHQLVHMNPTSNHIRRLECALTKCIDDTLDFC